MKFRSFTMAGIGAILLLACNSQNDKSYSLTLAAPTGSEGQMAYLSNFDTGIMIDSTVITGPEISFTGTIDSAMWVRVIVNGTRQGSLILEPGQLTLDSERNAKGGQLNHTYNKFEAYTDSISKIVQSLRTDSTATEQIAQLDKEYNNEKMRIINENKNNPVGYYIFLDDAYSFSAEQLDSALSVMPQMAKYNRIQRLKHTYNQRKATMPGNKFIDFEVTQPGDSTPVRLSDYVGHGKYTLVDFWASWCGPCIRETKTIKKLYEKYASSGLEVLGVAVWDDPDDTHRAIEKHQLPWPQIINAQSIPTDLYGIPAIPCIILFNPEGVIVSRDLMGDDLFRAVSYAMEQ